MARLNREGEEPNIYIPGVFALRRFERYWSWHLSWMHFPMSFPETPEVLGFTASGDGTRVQGDGILANAGYTERQGYWFRVPEDVEEFWIEFRENRAVNRVSVWNPDGERVWDRAYPAGERPSRTVIEVPAGQRGGLWRASGGSFILDPKIPPYFSVRPEEWFDPGR